MPKQPTEKTIKRLFAASGNKCAYRSCDVQMVDPISGTVLGEICHIKGQKRNSARYDPAQSDDDRHGFENLILLCPTHHKKIDESPDIYTIEYLQQMKTEHETRHTGGAELSDQVAKHLLQRILTRDRPLDLSIRDAVSPTTPTLGHNRLKLDEIKRACELALTEMLALQYPWGEWSASRPRPERKETHGAEGPTPNVATTFYCLENLEQLGSMALEEKKFNAVRWLSESLLYGWHRDWTLGTPESVDSRERSLIRRPDIRHTAEVACVRCRFGDAHDDLDEILLNLATAILKPSGFWSNSLDDQEPQLFASIFAVEALSSADAGYCKQPIQHQLKALQAAEVEDALRRGIGALLHDAALGNGLLGTSFKEFLSPSPYCSAVALRRLAPLSRTNEDLSKLTNRLINGLVDKAGRGGWYDKWFDRLATATDPKERRRIATLRTTLRVASGLAVAKKLNYSVPHDVWMTAVNLVQQFVIESTTSPLDSLEYSNALTCLLYVLDETGASVNVEFALKDSVAKADEYKVRWLQELEEHASKLSSGRQNNIPGYDKLGEIIDNRIRMLLA